MTRYICVTGAKGGVGKTTTAVNIASSLHKKGEDAVILDANLSTPAVHIHLGADNVDKHLHHAIEDKIHVSELIYTHPSGMKMIPTLTEMEHLKLPNYEGLKDVLMDMEGFADVVVLDTASGFGREAVVPMEIADEIVIVMTPDPGSLEAAKKTYEVARELNKQVLGVVLNMVRKDKLEHTVKEVEAALDLPVIAVVPHDDKVRLSWKKQNPVVHTHPRTTASRQFYKLASQLIGPKYVDHLKNLKTKEKKALKNVGL